MFFEFQCHEKYSDCYDCITNYPKLSKLETTILLCSLILGQELRQGTAGMSFLSLLHDIWILMKSGEGSTSEFKNHLKSFYLHVWYLAEISRRLDCQLEHLTGPFSLDLFLCSTADSG